MISDNELFNNNTDGHGLGEGADTNFTNYHEFAGCPQDASKHQARLPRGLPRQVDQSVQVSLVAIGGCGGSGLRSRHPAQTESAPASNVNKMKNGSLARRGPSANTRRIWASTIKAKIMQVVTR